MNTIKATTDVPPEDYHDTVYQVVDGEKPKPKYVHAVKIYGDDDKEAIASGRRGLVQTRVLLDLNDPTTEGKEEVFTPGDLIRPDIFPSLVRNPVLWKASYETPMPELCDAAWAMVERELFNEATAGVGQQFRLETDANKVVNAVKVLLSGYFGGFVLLQLLGWIKKKLFARIHQLNPPHPVSVDAKLSDIRIHGLKGVFDSRNFNRYYSGASVENNELVPLKVLDALSRTFPHRPVARVSLKRGGKIEHQPIYRHDIDMADDILVGDMISVKAIIALAVSMNMDEATTSEPIGVVLEFCADKSVFSSSVTISAGDVSVGKISCEQAGSLSPHSLIETRKTLKDTMLSNFVNSLKTHGVFTHPKHTRSVIFPFNVGKSLVSHLNKSDIGFHFQTNSANDTGVEILMLKPEGEHGRLIGYVTDRSVGADDEGVSSVADAGKFADLDTVSILQGEEPVIVLGTNPLMSFAASDVQDEYLDRFIRDSLNTLRRVVYDSSVFGVQHIFVTTNPSVSVPVSDRDVAVNFSFSTKPGFNATQLENFKAASSDSFVTRNPSSIAMSFVQHTSDSPVRVKYTFKGKDVDLAIELLYTVLQHSVSIK
jgi:hypothetical protein